MLGGTGSLSPAAENVTSDTVAYGLPVFLAPEPRGCPEVLGHSAGMSESPAGPKPAMLRADMPAAPSFQRAFTSSCTISGNSSGQRRER